MDRRFLEVYLPIQSYVAAMEFSSDEQVESILSHVFFGLDREALIDPNWCFGQADHIRKNFSEATNDGILFTPSALGVELFQWGHGLGHLPITDFLKRETVFQSGVTLATVPGFRATREITNDEQVPE